MVMHSQQAAETRPDPDQELQKVVVGPDAADAADTAGAARDQQGASSNYSTDWRAIIASRKAFTGICYNFSVATVFARQAFLFE